MSTYLNLTPTRTFSSPSHRKTNLAAAIMGRGTNVDEQRANRRQNLIGHFRSMRMKSLESFRNLKDDDLDLATLIEIKRRLSQANPGQIVDVQELDVIMSQVVTELELSLVEMYENEYVEEVNTTVNQLMDNKCLVCKSVVVQNSSICKNCTDEMAVQVQDFLPHPI